MEMLRFPITNVLAAVAVSVICVACHSHMTCCLGTWQWSCPLVLFLFMHTVPTMFVLLVDSLRDCLVWLYALVICDTAEMCQSSTERTHHVPEKELCMIDIHSYYSLDYPLPTMFLIIFLFKISKYISPTLKFSLLALYRWKNSYQLLPYYLRIQGFYFLC